MASNWLTLGVLLIPKDFEDCNSLDGDNSLTIKELVPKRIISLLDVVDKSTLPFVALFFQLQWTKLR